MRIYFCIAIFLALFASGCRRRSAPVTAHASPIPKPPPTSTTVAPAKIDTSKLLTRAEIESALDEPVKETAESAREEAGFAISQFYFTLQTPSNSVVLTVTRRGTGPNATEPRQFWAEKFQGAERAGASAERDGDEEEHERKQTPPEKVNGVGEAAYWVANGSTGALYALQADSFIRVAVGGAGDRAEKISRSVALARLALKRL